MTNGSGDAQGEFQEILRLRDQGLISDREAFERQSRLIDSLAASRPAAVATAPEPAPPPSPTPGARRFVFDGSDGISGTLSFDGPERLSRLLLFVKWLAFIPLSIWVAVYRAAALVLSFLAFLAILVTGRYPPGLFGFVRGYVASQYRVYSYFPLLLSDGWTAGENHPLNFSIEPQPAQSRLLLIFAKLPAMVLGAFFGIASIATTLLTLLAFPMWFAILFTGRYPSGIRRFALGMLQWSVRVTAWQFFMSDDWAMFGRTLKVRLPAIAAAYLFPALLIWFTFFGPRTDLLNSLTGLSDAKQVTHEFMVAARDGDVARAHRLIDPASISSAQFDALMTRTDLFQDYQYLTVQSWRREVSTVFGSRIQLEGSVVYSSGKRGSYSVVLVQRPGAWLIQTLILIPPR